MDSRSNQRSNCLGCPLPGGTVQVATIADRRSIGNVQIVYNTVTLALRSFAGQSKTLGTAVSVLRA